MRRGIFKFYTSQNFFTKIIKILIVVISNGLNTNS